MLEKTRFNNTYMETRQVFNLKPLLAPDFCHYKVGISPAGQAVYCPRKAVIRVNGHPMCAEHVQELGKQTS